MSIVYLLDRVSIRGIEGILLIFFERSHFSMIFFHTAAIVVLLIGTRYSNDFEPRIFPPPRIYVYIYIYIVAGVIMEMRSVIANQNSCE